MRLYNMGVRINKELRRQKDQEATPSVEPIRQLER
jgi:hypothetical protein